MYIKSLIQWRSSKSEETLEWVGQLKGKKEPQVYQNRSAVRFSKVVATKWANCEARRDPVVETLSRMVSFSDRRK